MKAVKTEQILVIDDDVELCHLVSEYLQAEGFAVDRERRVPADAVYGHWVSRIFCRPSCRAVSRSDRRKWLIFTNPERARRFGMRACKLCQAV